MAAPAPLSPEVLAALKADDTGPMVIVVSMVFTALAVIAVSLRCYTRVWLVKRFGVEDWFMIIAVLLSIGNGIAQVFEVKNGAGRHIALLSPAQGVAMMKSLYASILCYCASLTFTKLSILLQYYKVFTVRYMRIGIYVVMGICTAYGFESVLTGTFSCVPIDAFWNQEKKATAKCLHENVLYYANASIGISTDVMVAILPMRAVWNLQMPRKQKLALGFLLSLGLFVCIVSILRLMALIHLANHPENPSYNSGPTGYWSAIEVNLAIVCGSAPSLKPLFVRIIPQLASSFRSSGGRSGKSTLPSYVKNNSDHRSFIELKGGKISPDARDVVVVTGGQQNKYMPTDVAALPPLGGKGDISVTRDIRHSFETGPTSPSKSSSQYDLVYGQGRR